MKSLSRAVIAAFSVCIIYTITAVILAIKNIYLPDTLTQYFFMTFGIEFAAAASIKIAKSVVKSKETDDKIKRIKDNNLGVEKKDLSQSDNDYDYSGGEYYG